MDKHTERALTGAVERHAAVAARSAYEAARLVAVVQRSLERGRPDLAEPDARRLVGVAAELYAKLAAVGGADEVIAVVRAEEDATAALEAEASNG